MHLMVACQPFLFFSLIDDHISIYVMSCHVIGKEVLYKLIVTASIGFAIRLLLLATTISCRTYFGQEFESRINAARERAHNKRAAKMTARARVAVAAHYVPIDG
jgi:hypothetical protein